MIEDRGVSVRLILGNAYGEDAPATMFSETFYADVTLEPGSRLPMPDDHEDRGIYIVEGSDLGRRAGVRGGSDDGLPARATGSRSPPATGARG
jgi:redox-sensitive bicupin YhaK (pirin superfamily)